MKINVFTFLCLLYISACQTKAINSRTESSGYNNSISLLQMIEVREKAMKERDIPTIITQFKDNATWINSGGFYFRNKKEIEQFHTTLTRIDTFGYIYKAGKTTINILSPEFALVYYPWEMDWYKIASPKDTVKEVGLMSLTAQKDTSGWKWRAITNQHTYEYFDDLKTHINKQMIE
jgi:hypothetical protein